MTAPVVAAVVGGEASKHRGPVLALGMVLLWLAGVGFYIAFVGGFGDSAQSLLDTITGRVQQKVQEGSGGS